jgi:ATP-dependent DNA helicase PIF1
MLIVAWIGLTLVAIVITTGESILMHRKMLRSVYRGRAVTRCASLSETALGSKVMGVRRYHHPRYLSSATALAEWCYGSYDEADDFGVTYGISGSRGRSGESAVKSGPTSFQRTAVAPLKMTSFPSGDATIKSVITNSSSLKMSHGFTDEMEDDAAPAVSEPKKKKGKESIKIIAPVAAVSEGISVEAGKTALREEMREWRKLYSEEYQMPIYTVFSNKVLDGIIEHMPTTEEDLRALPGVGEKTLNKIKKKVLPLVRTVLEGKPFSSIASLEDGEESAHNGFLTSTSEPLASKSSKKARHSARMATILANMDMQQTINLEDLNGEQIDASDAILEGQNTFITGSAGTGKSFLLRYLVQELREKHGNNAVAVTASTGIAAINLGGQTIHSFAGIGLSSGGPDNSKVINKVSKNMRALKRWQDTKVLIVDEISMIDRPLFELLDQVGRAVRRRDEPFGGIQVVVVGDFFQLPPVPNKFRPQREFAFESPVWNTLGFGYTDEYGYMHCNHMNMVVLKQVVRQSDVDFANLLNDIRVGDISNRHLNALNSCVVSRKPPPTDGIVPTKLYSINKDVDKENLDRLLELPGDVVEVKSTDVWQELPSASSLKRPIKDNIERAIPENIQLKVGAQVMLLRNRNNNNNDDQYGSKNSALVNGSRGVITGFVKSTSTSGLVPRVCFDNGQEVVIGPVEYFSRGAGGDGHLVRSQIPLKLAWAVTIHKSQGSTLSRAELMLTNTFDYGQAYVALSRVTSFDGLWLTEPIQRNNIRANNLVLDYFSETQPVRGITPADAM